MNSKDRDVLIGKIEAYYKKNKGKSLYFYPLAVLYCQKNEKEKAYQILLEGLQYKPRYVLALLKIAEILIEENKYEAALAYLETAANIQKFNTKVLDYLALAYEKLGKYGDAIKVYEDIVAIEPDNEKAKSKMVEIAPMIKPPKDSIDDLMQDLEGSVENTDAKKERAENLAEVEELKGASADEKNADSEIDIKNMPEIDLEGDNDDSIGEESEEIPTVTLARLYEKQGYIEDAVKIYNKVLEKEPDNMEAKKALERIKSARENNNEKTD